MIKRQLNLNDLGEALRMPLEEAERLAAPLISDLRELAMPSYLDPAGIPYRGSEVFRELMEGPVTDICGLYFSRSPNTFEPIRDLGVQDH